MRTCTHTRTGSCQKTTPKTPFLDAPEEKNNCQHTHTHILAPEYTLVPAKGHSTVCSCLTHTHTFSLFFSYLLTHTHTQSYHSVQSSSGFALHLVSNIFIRFTFLCLTCILIQVRQAVKCIQN